MNEPFRYLLHHRILQLANVSHWPPGDRHRAAVWREADVWGAPVLNTKRDIDMAAISRSTSPPALCPAGRVNEMDCSTPVRL
jgi:hypothetical protein